MTRAQSHSGAAKSLFENVKDQGYCAVVRLLTEASEFGVAYRDQLDDCLSLCDRSDAKPYIDTAWPLALSERCRESFAIRDDAYLFQSESSADGLGGLSREQLHHELLFHFVPLAVLVAGSARADHENQLQRVEAINNLEVFAKSLPNIRAHLDTMIVDQSWSDDRSCASLLATRLQLQAFRVALNKVEVSNDLPKKLRAHQNRHRSDAREDRTAFAGVLGFAWARCTGESPTTSASFVAFVEQIAVALGGMEHDTWDRPVANAIKRWSTQFATVDKDPFLTAFFPGAVRKFIPKKDTGIASSLRIAVQQAALEELTDLAAGESVDLNFARWIFPKHFN